MGLLAMLGGLPALLGQLFGTVNHLTDAIANEKIAAMGAQTDQERIAAQERVNSLTLRRDALIAEAGVSRLNIYVRTGLAVGPLAVLLKIFLFDKAIGPFFGCVGRLEGEAAKACHMFTTDAMDANLWQVVSVVVGFYFLTELSLGVARRFGSK